MPGGELMFLWVDVPVHRLTDGSCPRCLGVGRVGKWIGAALIHIDRCRLCAGTGYHEIGVAG